MTGPRDPIEDWRDVSRRAAVATGYRPRSAGAARGSFVSIGVLAVVVAAVVGGLALRGPSPTTDAGGRIAATAEDASLRLTLTTPRGSYRPDEGIEPVATVTYLGPKASETIYHATSPIGFRIEEVGGQRQMAGGSRLPCLSTDLARGAPTAVPFAKAGSPDDPKDGFDLAWYEDPVLRLPAGTWRIIAVLLVDTGKGCGDDPHNLTVENIVRVVADNKPVPTPSAAADAPVVATAEDANVRLTLTTPRGTYTPGDKIEPVAAVTYLGPRATETLFHASSPIGFVIEEVGGTRKMGGGMDTPCLSTESAKGASTTVPFQKAGSSDNPLDGFDQAWYEDPVLQLPVGTWRIIANLDVYIGSCGGERHQLTVANVIVVVGDANPTADPSTAAPLTPDAAAALEVVRKYEDGVATGHLDQAWTFLSPWSQRLFGSQAAFEEVAIWFGPSPGTPYVVETPTRDPDLLDPAFLGSRAVDIAATTDPTTVFLVPVRYPATDGAAAGTQNVVVARTLEGAWQIWLDATPAAADPNGSSTP